MVTGMQEQVSNLGVSKPGKPFIVIGRHKFTERQKEMLEKAGFGEPVYRFDMVKNVEDVIEKCKELGCNAIIVQALPFDLLIKLIQLAQRNGIDVYGFRIHAVALVPADEQCPPEADIELIDPRSGNKRCSKTMELYRYKRVVIETEPVVQD